MTTRRVLVVDDDEASRYALVRLLQRDGYAVDSCPSGGEALARVAAPAPPHLVILDVVLPDITGLEVCRRIKDDPRTAQVMVLITSAAMVRSSDRAFGLDSGADGYLTQPIDPIELGATVRALLRTLAVEERLLRSNQELEMFAHAAAHDLREPLRMIANFTQLIQRRHLGELSEKPREWFGLIADATQRMGKLIDGLLAFAAIDGAEPAAARVAFGDLVAAAESDLAAALRDSGGTVERVGDLPTVDVEPVQIAQVLQNLIGNALKFRRAEPPRVAIAASDRGDDWLISVSDNGSGIAPEHRERVFGLFQRLHDDPSVRGTGLGLALCRKIVERHGGRIWVESEVGRGSVFRFTLPKVRPGVAEQVALAR